jgi:hypothetical protein
MIDLSQLCTLTMVLSKLSWFANLRLGIGLLPPQVRLGVCPQGESASAPDPPEQPCSGQDGFRHSLVLRIR